LNAFPGNSLLLFAPRREGKVNLANPAASFLGDSVIVTGVYQSNQADYDENRIVVDIDIARDIFLYDEEASAVEVKGRDGITSTELAEKIAASLNGGEKSGAYVVKDRLRQQEMNFRMISIEKWVTFLLLFFILVIASFNIISSLSMLVIDKERSISTLNSLGMSKGKIASIFRWESIFVSLTGGAAGLAIGLLLCWLQQNFGFIKLQGDPSQLVVQSYPVMLDPLDILITFIPLILIAFVTALITGNFAKSRIGLG
ncbi:MAG: FtsX-like permease family protein, partial [Muribaculaceae bacterium]|nr:FtsX-like permease family protein [Muribaculaceae bacterium]